MPRCNVGWLGWLAGLAGWLGWLAAAGGLLLAGCCWLMEGSLTRSTLWGGRRIYLYTYIGFCLFTDFVQVTFLAGGGVD